MLILIYSLVYATLTKPFIGVRRFYVVSDYVLIGSTLWRGWLSRPGKVNRPFVDFLSIARFRRQLRSEKLTQTAEIYIHIVHCQLHCYFSRSSSPFKLAALGVPKRILILTRAQGDPKTDRYIREKQSGLSDHVEFIHMYQEFREFFFFYISEKCFIVKKYFNLQYLEARRSYWHSEDKTTIILDFRDIAILSRHRKYFTWLFIMYMTSHVRASLLNGDEIDWSDNESQIYHILSSQVERLLNYVFRYTNFIKASKLIFHNCASDRSTKFSDRINQM